MWTLWVPLYVWSAKSKQMVYFITIPSYLNFNDIFFSFCQVLDEDAWILCSHVTPWVDCSIVVLTSIIDDVFHLVVLLSAVHLSVVHMVVFMDPVKSDECILRKRNLDRWTNKVGLFDNLLFVQRGPWPVTSTIYELGITSVDWDNEEPLDHLTIIS